MYFTLVATDALVTISTHSNAVTAGWLHSTLASTRLTSGSLNALFQKNSLTKPQQRIVGKYHNRILYCT